MNILEKELEDLIWDRIQADDFKGLHQRGLSLPCVSKYFRQFNFGSYGIADICSIRIRKNPTSKFDYVAHIDIIELKKGEVNTDTLFQAIGYARAAQLMVSDYSSDLENKGIRAELRLILIGKSIETKTSFCYTPSLFENVHLYTYELDFYTGISFQKRDGYFNANDNLPNVPKLDFKNFH